ncbi:MAG TPA: hypothetical protein GX708_24210 [Gallicola sp.]|nr:hypothetical protein [Gallicola sp.]
MNIEKTSSTGLNVTITKTSEVIIEKFINSGYFADKKDVAKLAIAYALGKEYDKGIDLDDYSFPDNEETKNVWAVGSINEPYFEKILSILRPEIKNINRVLRNLIDIGLKELYKNLYNEDLDEIEIEKLFE